MSEKFPIPIPALLEFSILLQSLIKSLSYNLEIKDKEDLLLYAKTRMSNEDYMLFEMHLNDFLEVFCGSC